MYTLKFNLESVAPYIQNNPISTIPQIRSTNTKTPLGKRESDPLVTGYKNDEGYYIPQRQLWGAGREAAKKVKLRKTFMGKLYKAIIANIEPLEVQLMRDGKPIQEPDSIYNDPIFKQNGEMVFSPRVMFNNWSAGVTVTVLEESVPEEKIVEIFQLAGLYIGVGSRRPMYGRFLVNLA